MGHLKEAVGVGEDVAGRRGDIHMQAARAGILGGPWQAAGSAAGPAPRHRLQVLQDVRQAGARAAYLQLVPLHLHACHNCPTGRHASHVHQTWRCELESVATAQEAEGGGRTWTASIIVRTSRAARKMEDCAVCASGSVASGRESQPSAEMMASRQPMTSCRGVLSSCVAASRSCRLSDSSSLACRPSIADLASPALESTAPQGRVHAYSECEGTRYANRAWSQQAPPSADARMSC